MIADICTTPDMGEKKLCPINVRRPARPYVKRLLNFGDTCLSLFVITPLVVAHWRGTWSLMDANAEHFPAWIGFLFGGVLHTTFALIRDPLTAVFTRTPAMTNTDVEHNLNCNGVHATATTTTTTGTNVRETIKRHFITKLYTYVFSAGCIMHWRGGWAVLELYTGTALWPAVFTSSICLIALIGLRAVRNLIAPPFCIGLDSKDAAFAFPTRFRVEGSREPGLYVLDCIFSVLVIGSLVVFVWRGIWVLFDLTVYPGDVIKSSWASLIIGYGIVAITFAIQPAIRWMCDRLSGFWRIGVADLFLFFSFIGTVNVWRSVWSLLDEFFLPDDKFWSNWITHGISWLLLALLNCANSVLVRGVYIDAEEPAGQCVIFPVYYFRLLFQSERTKKQQRRLIEMDEHANDIAATSVHLIEKPAAKNVTIVRSAAGNLLNKTVTSTEMTTPMTTGTIAATTIAGHLLSDREKLEKT